MRLLIINILIAILIIFITDAKGQDAQPTGDWEKTWQMKPGVLRVLKQGQVGVVNNDGKILVPCQYDQVYDLTDDNYLRVLKNLKIGLYHLEKGLILPAEYDQIWPFNGDMAKVLKNGKTGFINKEGFVVIPTEFNHIWPEENGLIKVLKDGKMGYFDNSGKIIAPVDYQQIWSFEEDLARVLKGGKMGYIDRNGNEVIPPMYDQVWAFKDGKAKALQSGEVLYIDKQGKMVDAPIIQQDSSMSIPVSTNNSDTISQSVKIGPISVTTSETSDGQKSQQYRFGKSNKRKIPFQGHLAGVNLGINSYLDALGNEDLPNDYRFMELNHEKSVEVTIYPGQQSVKLIGSRFGMVTALGLQFNNYRFDLTSPAQLNETGLSWFPAMPDNANIAKAKLTSFFLTVPVLLELQIPDGRNREGLYLAAGIEGGLRLRSHAKVIYTSDSSRFKRKLRDNFDLNGLRYSYIARAGYRNFGIYGSYTPVSLFKSNKGPELYPFSVGVTFNIK